MNRPGKHALLPRRVAASLVVLALLVTACRSVPPVTGERPAVPGAPSTADARRGEFAVPASMLDTWNAVGQILVRQDGVTYEGRSQMLGLYSVRYRGERFLILTRARVLEKPTDGMLTRVGAAQQDGKPNGSAAAVELLGLLRQQLPAEIARIAAGQR